MFRKSFSGISMAAKLARLTKPRCLALSCQLVTNQMVSNQTTKYNKCDMKISPQNVLMDEDFNIISGGLKPKQEVSLVSRVVEKDIGLYAVGYYTASSDGMVDVSKMEAQTGGTYEGIEPMGLIWSQKQDPDQASGKLLTKPAVTEPTQTRFYLLDEFRSHEECLKLITDGHWMCQATCQRSYMADGVEKIEVKGGRLLATLFIPKGDGPFPGVLDLSGATGSITEYRSALLASRGIASMTLQYFMPAKSLEQSLINDIEYYEEALDFLLSHPKVMKPYAGVIGTSLGGMIAMLLASVCSKIKACVEINSGNVTVFADYTYKGRVFKKHNAHADKINFTEQGVEWLHMFEARIKDPKESIIPLEDAACEFLFIHGTDDRCVPYTSADYLAKYLKKHGKTNYKSFVYPGAGHLIEPPHSPLCKMSFHPIGNTMLSWGGKPKEHARAQEHSWQEILNFFKTNITQANKAQAHLQAKL